MFLKPKNVPDLASIMVTVWLNVSNRETKPAPMTGPGCLPGLIKCEKSNLQIQLFDLKFKTFMHMNHPV